MREVAVATIARLQTRKAFVPESSSGPPVLSVESGTNAAVSSTPFSLAVMPSESLLLLKEPTDSFDLIESCASCGFGVGANVCGAAVGVSVVGVFVGLMDIVGACVGFGDLVGFREIVGVPVGADVGELVGSTRKRQVLST
uniref:Uncharacterized protein n=1 Tax=Trieres chinensis TaxID=1514140 RepID=A0A7S1ZMI0_TRICV|mmetsp:Transcript_28700/g.58779  ORF Transcript_28700/g.58779 Transcript_28700/m.58779 type:complete len:141 (+) Transcript_28700:87-509(+)